MNTSRVGADPEELMFPKTVSGIFRELKFNLQRFASKYVL